MRGLEFSSAPSTVPTASQRADVTCFVGFLRTRASVGVGVPVDSLEEFSRRFAWVDADGVASPTGEAVRLYFAQGGRRCHVVPIADPGGDRASRAAALLPGFDLAQELLVRSPGQAPFLSPSRVSPQERASWAGAGQLYAVPSATFLTLPDLPWLFAAPPPAPEEEPALGGADGFVECAEPPRSPASTPPPPPRVPILDEEGWRGWIAAVRWLVRRLIAPTRRDTQLVLDLPDGGGPRLAAPFEAALEDLLASAHLQLVWPWLLLQGSTDPIAPAPAMLGILARSALTRGAWRTVAGQPIFGVRAVTPAQTREREARLGERLCVLSPTPRGVEVYTDVTTSADPAWREGSTNRVMICLIRAARRLGEDLTFDTSNAELWGRIRRRMEGLLGQLYREGALAGASPAEAYTVRCDRGTMTQDDLDAGRVIAVVAFRPGTSVKHIRVSLALDGHGLAALQALGGQP